MQANEKQIGQNSNTLQPPERLPQTKVMLLLMELYVCKKRKERYKITNN